MRNFIFIIACTACVLLSTAAHANGSATECALPYAKFKYSYMDSIINSTPKPSDKQFLDSLHVGMDASELQLYLWYVYRNPGLSAEFFNKINLQNLVTRNNDSINSILWLMQNDKKSFPGISEDSRQKIEAWKVSYGNRHAARSAILNAYAHTDYFARKDGLASVDDEDVDFLLKKGVSSEARGNNLEALFYYTRVAEFGYQQGLVGAAILLPRLGGNSCARRAGYYVRLSGAIAPITWIGP